MRTFLVVILAGVALVYAALWHGKPVFDSLLTTDLPTLLDRANEYDGRIVTIHGVVLPGGAIMGVGGYRVKEGDAEILVLGHHGIPAVGSEVRVRGTFKQAFAIGGLQYAVILEKESSQVGDKIGTTHRPLADIQ